MIVKRYPTGIRSFYIILDDSVDCCNPAKFYRRYVDNIDYYKRQPWEKYV